MSIHYIYVLTSTTLGTLSPCYVCVSLPTSTSLVLFPVWTMKSTGLAARLCVCVQDVRTSYSCTPFRHGTWEIDTCNIVCFPCTMPKWGTTNLYPVATDS